MIGMIEVPPLFGCHRQEVVSHQGLHLHNFSLLPGKEVQIDQIHIFNHVYMYQYDQSPSSVWLPLASDGESPRFAFALSSQ